MAGFSSRPRRCFRRSRIPPWTRYGSRIQSCGYSQNFDPEFISELFSTSNNPPLFWFAFILMIPLFHEFLFRGFLFAGWSRSKLGVTGTILLTSILWALIHLSYGFYHIATLFVFGIFLGLARHRTQSLIVPIAIHCLMNLITTIQGLFMFQH